MIITKIGINHTIIRKKRFLFLLSSFFLKISALNIPISVTIVPKNVTFAEIFPNSF